MPVQPLPYHLSRDPAENAPSFEDNLYGSLDVDIIELIALWWFFIDYLTGKPLIGVACVYIGELLLKHLRATLGEKNLVKKTFTDDRFLK